MQIPGPYPQVFQYSGAETVPRNLHFYKCPHGESDMSLEEVRGQDMRCYKNIIQRVSLTIQYQVSD
jgi:hypothetical protein